jgi:uncharacterized membrane protein
MAIDHVRDYFHAGSFLFDPTDITQTNAPLFFTRWITHFCAPVFVFLAGTSAYLVGQRKSKKQLMHFLFTRGLWLILLEVSIVNFGWYFNPEFPFFRLSVIWALGISMTALSALIYLPQKLILAIGIVIVAGHNLLDNIHLSGTGWKAFLWALIHEPKNFTFSGHTIRTGYPVLPWIGIMALGYCFGSLYRKEVDVQKRKKSLLTIGLSGTVLFLIIRAVNIYGDKALWAVQDNLLFTIISFLNVSKYPPSLLFTLMTLGPSLIFLAFAEKYSGKIVLAITRIGRVPMFFYILHIYLIHTIALLVIEFTGKGWKNMILIGNSDDNPQLKGYGFSLYVVYLIWCVVIIILYPLCKWYDRYKATHKEKLWLSYL